VTVAELIALLRTMDPTRLVVCSRDPEGNHFSPLASLDSNAAYLAENSHEGEVKCQQLSDALREALCSDEDIAPPEAVPCLVLWPTS
jgi:hypothetical protein